jgi:hypothetical protein
MVCLRKHCGRSTSRATSRKETIIGHWSPSSAIGDLTLSTAIASARGMPRWPDQSTSRFAFGSPTRSQPCHSPNRSGSEMLKPRRFPSCCRSLPAARSRRRSPSHVSEIRPSKRRLAARSRALHRRSSFMTGCCEDCAMRCRHPRRTGSCAAPYCVSTMALRKPTSACILLRLRPLIPASA